MQNLALLLAVAVGCSARVEVSDESTTEKSIVAVEVGVLVDRKSEPAPVTPAATPEKCKVAQESRQAPEPASRETGNVSAEKSVKLVRNVVNVYEGDLHLHNDTHNHFYEPRKSRESVKVRVEVGLEPERDERCSRLLREHLEMVKEWEAMFR